MIFVLGILKIMKNFTKVDYLAILSKAKLEKGLNYPLLSLGKRKSQSKYKYRHAIGTPFLS
jgi:hypothetical protein